MTIQEANNKHSELFEKALELLQKKRVDYADNVDPFANFRQSKLCGVEPSKGSFIRMMDKVSRMARLMSKGGVGGVADESLADTVIDLCNYAVITLLLYQEELGSKKECV